MGCIFGSEIVITFSWELIKHISVQLNFAAIFQSTSYYLCIACTLLYNFPTRSIYSPPAVKLAHQKFVMNRRKKSRSHHQKKQKEPDENNPLINEIEHNKMTLIADIDLKLFEHADDCNCEEEFQLDVFAENYDLTSHEKVELKTILNNFKESYICFTQCNVTEMRNIIKKFDSKIPHKDNMLNNLMHKIREFLSTLEDAIQEAEECSLHYVEGTPFLIDPSMVPYLGTQVDAMEFINVTFRGKVVFPSGIHVIDFTQIGAYFIVLSDIFGQKLKSRDWVDMNVRDNARLMYKTHDYAYKLFENLEQACDLANLFAEYLRRENYRPELQSQDSSKKPRCFNTKENKTSDNIVKDSLESRKFLQCKHEFKKRTPCDCPLPKLLQNNNKIPEQEIVRNEKKAVPKNQANANKPSKISVDARTDAVKFKPDLLNSNEDKITRIFTKKPKKENKSNRKIVIENAKKEIAQRKARESKNDKTKHKKEPSSKNKLKKSCNNKSGTKWKDLHRMQNLKSTRNNVFIESKSDDTSKNDKQLARLNMMNFNKAAKLNRAPAPRDAVMVQDDENDSMYRIANYVNAFFDHQNEVNVEEEDNDSNFENNETEDSVFSLLDECKQDLIVNDNFEVLMRLACCDSSLFEQNLDMLSRPQKPKLENEYKDAGNEVSINPEAAHQLACVSFTTNNSIDTNPVIPSTVANVNLPLNSAGNELQENSFALQQKILPEIEEYGICYSAPNVSEFIVERPHTYSTNEAAFENNFTNTNIDTTSEQDASSVFYNKSESIIDLDCWVNVPEFFPKNPSILVQPKVRNDLPHSRPEKSEANLKLEYIERNLKERIAASFKQLHQNLSLHDQTVLIDSAAGTIELDPYFALISVGYEAVIIEDENNISRLHFDHKRIERRLARIRNKLAQTLCGDAMCDRIIFNCDVAYDLRNRHRCLFER